MKTKSFLWLIPVLMLAMASCQKDSDLTADESLIDDISDSWFKKQIDLSELPTTITQKVSEVYFETYTESAYKVRSKGYELVMGSGEKAYFDIDGNMLKGAGMRTECGGEGHPGGGRPHGDRGGEGPRGGGGGHHGGGGHPGGGGHHGGGMPGDSAHHNADTVALSTLPQAIFDYVDANYDTAVVEKAKLINGEYFVKITGHIILHFDAQGTFIEVLPMGPRFCDATDVAIADLPAAITDYINANYAGAEIKRAAKTDDRYIVGTLYNDKPLVLFFDLDGKFIEAHTPGR